MARRLILSLSAYVAAFGPAAFSWIQMAGGAIPSGAPSISPEDARLHAWILAWVTHALVTAPARLFDANINYPAPMQLAGSEHFLSSQILFAPVFLLTGNAVLAVNVLVMLSYPLAALAMQQLLIRLGCRVLPAWTAGLVYALGPLRSTGNFQMLQYLNVYLPWTALALHRLRDRPTIGRAVVVAVVLLLASFSSYYMAVLVLFLTLLWGGLELLHAGPARTRFTLLAAGAVAAAVGPLLLFSGPYSDRAEQVGSVASLLNMPPTEQMALLGPGDFHTTFNPIELALAGFGALLLASRKAPVGRLSRMGLLIAVSGTAFMLGPLHLLLAGRPVWFPYYVVAASPLRFFRCWWRFSVLAAFGTALLTAAALEWLSRRPRLRPAVLVFAIVLLVSRVPLLGGSGLDAMVGQTRPVYAELARVARREGAGPLLELPTVTVDGIRTQMEATLASTRHWLPLVTGHTGYPSPHRALVDRLISRLPESNALDELVSLTHVRWILLQPAEYWSAPQARAAILQLSGVHRVLWYDGWDLLRVERADAAADDRWFHAIAAGWREGHTLLGTPIAPLAPEAAKAALMATTEMPPTMVQGRRTVVDITVANHGSADWPVTLPPWLPDTYRAQLRMRWMEKGVTVREVLSETAPLPRDVAAGEQLRVQVPLVAPRAWGTFKLVISVEQVGSPSFAGPNGGDFETMVVVTVAPLRRARRAGTRARARGHHVAHAGSRAASLG